MSDTCGDDFCNQRTRDGTDNNGCPCNVKHVDLHAAKDYPGQCACTVFYCDRGIVCHNGAVLLEGFIPSLYDSLGLYIPLIVVNCIILGRAESYASKNPVLPSIFDGLGMGLGFTVGLTAIGMVREIIGSGKIFGWKIMPASYEPITIFVLAPGAFFVLACLVAVQNKVKAAKAKGGQQEAASGCDGSCASCGNGSCGKAVFSVEKQEGK